MSVILFGNVDEDEIFFSDFIVKIDYGDKNKGEFGFIGCSDACNRRFRLFDREGNLIEEIIDDNPYQFDFPYEDLDKIFPKNSKIIY